MGKIVFSLVVIWFAIMARTLLAQDLAWENISTDNLGFQTLLINSQDNQIIFAGQSGNILKSVNAGKNWRRVLSIRSRMRKINLIVMDENNFKDIYAATDNGLYRSHDLGERWEKIFRGKNNQENQCSAVNICGKIILLGTKAGLFLSWDDGRSWSKEASSIGNRSVLSLDSGGGQNKIIYLAAINGIFKSLDHGQSWEKLFVGSTRRIIEEEQYLEDEDEFVGLFNVQFVKVDRVNVNRVYFSSTQGIYKSSNQGASWEKMTEYGLLTPNVKMICLSNSLGLYALTASGVFYYSHEHWLEVTFGLAAGKLSYLALDNLNNIYIAGEKGIFKSTPAAVSNFSNKFLLDEYLKYEPNIRDLQKAAIEYAEVSPKKILQWRKDAAKKALLPQINIGLDRNSADLWHWEGGSTTKNEDDVLRRGRDNLDWDVSLTWDLSDLIWNDAQVSIDARSKLMVELRDDILDQVNKLYFERLRVKNELDVLALEDRSKRFQKQLKLEELAASLDSLTAGYYSEQLRLIMSKQ